MNAIGTTSLWKRKITGDVSPSTEEIERVEKRFPRRQ